VVVHLVVTVFGGALTLEGFFAQVRELVLSLLNVRWCGATGQMAVKEDKGRVFEAEANGEGALIPATIAHRWLDEAHGYVVDADLYIGLGDQHDK